MPDPILLSTEPYHQEFVYYEDDGTVYGQIYYEDRSSRVLLSEDEERNLLAILKEKYEGANAR